MGSLPPLLLLSMVPLSGVPITSLANPPAPLVIPSRALPPTAIPPTNSNTAGGDLSLSMSLHPVPARVVSLIQSGRFIEMRDLLTDNVTVRSHFEDMHGALGVQLLPVNTRPRVREITTLPSWICCFLTYLAVGTSDPTTRDRLAYAILLIREAMRHGGRGWMEYDRLFRQQAAIDPGLAWNTIHPGLQATTVLSQPPQGAGTFCSLCRECDHIAANCALAQFQHPTTRATNAPNTSGSAQRRICSSWNDGSCTYPGSCSYQHICSNCFHSSHRNRDCRAPPRARGPPPTPAPTSRSS